MPYLLRAGKRAGENVADAVGDEAARLVKALWQKVGPKIEEKPAAVEVAQDVADDPSNEPALKSLEYQIGKLLAADPGLAGEVRSLLEQAQQSGVVLSGGQHAETGGVIAGQIFGGVQTGGSDR
ncbi:MAG TPA: hypothetical protein VFL61_10820 [Gaiellaceae bacterium]|nr:hypothetical protein [Gaiellaceae bacterium]